MRHAERSGVRVTVDHESAASDVRSVMLREIRTQMIRAGVVKQDEDAIAEAIVTGKVARKGLRDVRRAALTGRAKNDFHFGSFALRTSTLVPI